MPSRPPKACRERGCRLTCNDSTGYCDKHKGLASWGKWQTQRGKSKYNSQKWRNTRQAIIKRDKGLCQSCLSRGVIRSGCEVDHIKPLSQGGHMWSYSNLKLLCSECHAKKTALNK